MASLPLSGRVVDQGSKPVAGATVWLSARERVGADVEELARVQTNAGGQFTIDVPPGRERAAPLTLWAYSPGARVAVLSLEGRPNEDRGAVELALGPPSKVHVRVLGNDDKPVAGARVRPTSLVCPGSFADRVEAVTDAEGRAALEGVGPGQVFELDVIEDGFGAQSQKVAESEAEKTVHLLPVGQIAARLVSDNARALAGWTVIASSRACERRPRLVDEPGTRAQRRIRARRDAGSRGGLRDVRGRRAGGTALPGRRAAARPTPQGETVDVKVPVRKAVRVVGTVREHDTGKPAAGVKVNLFGHSPGGRNVDAVTDAEGRFARDVLPGKYQLGLDLVGLPERYYAPSVLIRPADEVAASEDPHTVPPLEVWPATVLKGVVLDDADKPVAGASVVAKGTTHGNSAQSFYEHAMSDRRGAFAVGHVLPRSTVTVRGTLASRVESPSVTVWVNADGVQDAPITLRLVIRKPAVSLRGRVLGPGSRAVAGAEVTIVLEDGAGQHAVGNFEGKRLRTGPDGTFRTPEEVPIAARYRLSVLAPGMEPAQGDWSDARGGQLPDLVMRPVSRLREVRGRVLDTQGRPVAEAEVFQAGDGPRRTGGTTDAEGRFRVPGVFATPAFSRGKRATASPARESGRATSRSSSSLPGRTSRRPRR